ncbi:hypothetical protein M2139_001524 [Enterococcus sp. PF1-24]|uniref:hypothetical protein n=1 Tax=unclassified Enterococcus TaxID=2608891 RepID=UPI0024745D20|nr:MULTISPECIES: hypothetical protein [unclassified Enterococcus]MDH6364485.1 hypothetical protein [Enterococcus sp. PFB1-1]MDH6401638.1 hypothetical protein [Enterococcus sp. PF1-24]
MEIENNILYLKRDHCVAGVFHDVNLIPEKTVSGDHYIRLFKKRKRFNPKLVSVKNWQEGICPFGFVKFNHSPKVFEIKEIWECKKTVNITVTEEIPRDFLPSKPKKSRKQVIRDRKNAPEKKRFNKVLEFLKTQKTDVTVSLIAKQTNLSKNVVMDCVKRIPQAEKSSIVVNGKKEILVFMKKKRGVSEYARAKRL